MPLPQETEISTSTHIRNLSSAAPPSGCRFTAPTRHRRFSSGGGMDR
ncbi:hypothetical protein MUK42_15242 [Musa troglodytarum]|uniref:Uncharacterized protein n=1 Tax=Musa troglodytarum TaxID=320322 RepID=A0A9E7LEH4_9LILI|nr:hypothetical protein MUK42_15242 [Musa troglodytarum]